MATQKICDGCGKPDSIDDAVIGITVSEAGDVLRARGHDLCETCFDKFTPALLAPKRRKRKASA